MQMLLRLRAVLKRRCTRAPKHVCLYRELRDIELHSPRARAGALLAAQYAGVYWNATFCLQPVGDTFTRKGTVDALLLGCIPVGFHGGTFDQYPWHWEDWRRRASVVLDMKAVIKGDLDVVEALSAIPQHKVLLMQQTIAQNAHRLQYSLQEAGVVPDLIPEDAFTLTLAGAWRRAQRATSSGVLARRAGMCKVTAAEQDGSAGPFVRLPEGDCEAGDAGSWFAMTLRACAERCVACPRCEYVSHSHVYRHCAWFHRCTFDDLVIEHHSAGLPPSTLAAVRTHSTYDRAALLECVADSANYSKLGQAHLEGDHTSQGPRCRLVAFDPPAWARVT
jgi:hypothetical protein